MYNNDNNQNYNNMVPNQNIPNYNNVPQQPTFQMPPQTMMVPEQNIAPTPNQPKSNKKVIIIIIIIAVLIIGGGVTTTVVLLNNSKDKIVEEAKKEIVEEIVEEEKEEEHKEEPVQKIKWESVEFIPDNVNRFKDLTYDIPIEWLVMYGGEDNIPFPLPDPNEEEGRIWQFYTWSLNSGWHKNVKEDKKTQNTYIEYYRAEYDEGSKDIRIKAATYANNGVLSVSDIQSNATSSYYTDNGRITDMVYNINEKFAGYIVTRKFDSTVYKEYNLYLSFNESNIRFNIEISGEDEETVDLFASQYFELYGLKNELQFIMTTNEKWQNNMTTW